MQKYGAVEIYCIHTHRYEHTVHICINALKCTHAETSSWIILITLKGDREDFFSYYLHKLCST